MALVEWLTVLKFAGMQFRHPYYRQCTILFHGTNVLRIGDSGHVRSNVNDN